MSRIAVAGAGGWGTALAILAHRLGHQVCLLARRPETAAALSRHGENRTYLAGVPLPRAVRVEWAPECVSGADLLLLAVPTAHLEAVASRILPYLGSTPIVSCAKGLDPISYRRPTQVLAACLPAGAPPPIALSGPNHAEELGRGLPAASVVACADPSLAAFAADLLAGPGLRTYQSSDLTGVELAGALKNIIVIACGISDGLGLGDNARGALMTRGLREIARLGVALGARAETFFGLAGLGDLVATATSPHSRNRRAGIQIAQGASLRSVLDAASPMAVEGVPTARAARTLALDLGLDLPIVEQVHAVLYSGRPPRDAVAHLASRETGLEDPLGVG